MPACFPSASEQPFLCCCCCCRRRRLLPLPTQQQPNPLEEPATRTPDCRGKRAPSPTSSPGILSCAPSPGNNTSKLQPFPKEPKKSAEMSTAWSKKLGFGQPTEQTRGETEAGRRSWAHQITEQLDNPTTFTSTSHALAEPRPAAATHQNRLKSPIARAARSEPATRPKPPAPAPAPRDPLGRRAQGTSGRVGSERSRPAASTGWPPIRRRRPNRAARPLGGEWRKRQEAPGWGMTGNPRGGLGRHGWIEARGVEWSGVVRSSLLSFPFFFLFWFMGKPRIAKRASRRQ